MLIAANSEASKEKLVSSALPLVADIELVIQRPARSDPEEQTLQTKISEHSAQLGMQVIQLGGFMAG